MQAAVLRALGEGLVIEDLELRPVAPHEVLVRIMASGVCHSDYSFTTGVLKGSPLPCILGHEGAGIVEEVGSATAGPAPGQNVIMAWQAPCRSCPQCLAGQPSLCGAGVFGEAVRVSRATVRGQPVSSMNGLGTFATHAVIPAEMAIPFDDSHSFEVAALVGCAVMTGVGAAIHAPVRPGETVAVVGCGGVGLSAIQGARLAGARRIVAIDRLDSKLELSRHHGATDLLPSENASDAIAELTGGVGVDHAFDCVGLPATIRAAFDAARVGGTVTVVGIGAPAEPLPLTLGDLVTSGRSIRFSRYGDADMRRDAVRLLDLDARGLLDLDSLIGERIPLSGVNAALGEVASGTSVRSIITFDS